MSDVIIKDSEVSALQTDAKAIKYPEASTAPVPPIVPPRSADVTAEHGTAVPAIVTAAEPLVTSTGVPAQDVISTHAFNKVHSELTELKDKLCLLVKECLKKGMEIPAEISAWFSTKHQESASVTEVKNELTNLAQQKQNEAAYAQFKGRHGQ